MQGDVPPGQLFGDEHPLVAQLVVGLLQNPLLLGSPLGFHYFGVQVVLVSRWGVGYLSRHCLPVRPLMLNSWDIIRAMVDHLCSSLCSLSRRRILSSCSLQALRSDID